MTMEERLDMAIVKTADELAHVSFWGEYRRKWTARNHDKSDALIASYSYEQTEMRDRLQILIAIKYEGYEVHGCINEIIYTAESYARAIINGYDEGIYTEQELEDMAQSYETDGAGQKFMEYIDKLMK